MPRTYIAPPMCGGPPPPLTSAKSSRFDLNPDTSDLGNLINTTCDSRSSVPQTPHYVRGPRSIPLLVTLHMDTITRILLLYQLHLLCDIRATYCASLSLISSLFTSPSDSITDPFTDPTAHSLTFISDTPKYRTTLTCTCFISTPASNTRFLM